VTLEVEIVVSEVDEEFSFACDMMRQDSLRLSSLIEDMFVADIVTPNKIHGTC
jgi:hypothetical protein